MVDMTTTNTSTDNVYWGLWRHYPTVAADARAAQILISQVGHTEKMGGR